MEQQKLSEQISDVLSFFESAQKEYEERQAELAHCNDMTQDILHSLELDGLLYDDRAKLATKLSRCRQSRRTAKDRALTLDPLIELLSSDKGKQFSRQLSEVLGKTRGAERRLENRVYNRRCTENS